MVRSGAESSAQSGPRSRSGADQSKSNSSYIPSLDGLRAIAFLCVFGAHTGAHTISRFVPASFGVTVFFFLSGFLITTLLRKEALETGTIALKDFYIRRALRIFVPLYLSYMIAAVILKVFLHDSAGTVSGAVSVFFYYFNYARMLSPTLLLPIGIDVAWSLSVEEHFYFLFPLLYLTFTRRKTPVRSQVALLIALCAIVLCWRTYVHYHNFPVNWTYFATDCRFDSILFGCLLAIGNNPTVDEAGPIMRRFSGLLALGSLVMILGTMATKSFAFRETFRYTIQGIGLYFIFYYVVRWSKHWTTRWLANPALRYVGWLSYSMYLIHVFILRQVEPHLPQKDWIVAAVVFLLALGYAFLMRQFVEKPLQRMRARFRHAPVALAPTGVEGI